LNEVTDGTGGSVDAVTGAEIGPYRKSPLVSICIPTYNGSAFLHKCLESALGQTQPDVEVVVVDDASTDETPAIVADYARRDPRIRLYRNPVNLGLSKNRTQCVDLARGEWIKFLFQDDYLEPECLQKMLKAHGFGALLVVCRRNIIFEPETPDAIRTAYESHLRNHSLPRHFPGCSFISAEAFAAHMVRYPTINCIGEPTATLVHHSAFQRFGRYHEYIIQMADWEFSARIAVNAGLCYVDDALATFRVHGKSVSANNRTRRAFRTDAIDGLVILHDLVYSTAYAGVRAAATRCTPPVNLRHRLLDAARWARERAYAEAQGSQTYLSVLEWEEAVRRYPRLVRLSPGYVLSKVLGKARRRLGRFASMPT
jgi:GT2 family glycosyltransferase